MRRIEEKRKQDFTLVFYKRQSKKRVLILQERLRIMSTTNDKCQAEVHFPRGGGGEEVRGTPGNILGGGRPVVGVCRLVLQILT